MHLHRRHLLAIVAAPAMPALARAQERWPDRPLRFYISAQVGGVSDIFLRLMENRLRERLGQPLVVEPKLGGGGLPAAMAAINANDRHSFTVNHIASHGIGPSLYRNRGDFDPLRDLPGVCRIAQLPNVLFVKSTTPVRSVAELVGFIRANPQRANFSSAGAGTSSHLSGVLFCQRMGVEATHIPYRGTAPAMAAVLNGEVLFAIDNAPASRQQVLAGSLRAIGVSTAQPAATLPELPTLQSQGVADFDVASWYGIAAPAHTPRAVVDRLAAEILGCIADPDIAARLRDYGAEPWPLDTDGYNAFMRQEVAKWAPVVASSGATVN